MVNFIPVQEGNYAQENNYQNYQQNYPQNGGSGFRTWPIAVLIAVIAVMGFYLFFGDKIASLGANISGTVMPMEDRYQAVFISTGQVYFGRLTIDGQWLKLEDVYYLQSSQSGEQSTIPSNFQLVKLGSEIHGPEDVMFIDSRQVLFWEDLTPESQVVQAISKYKK